jgi:hypothetical protein
MVQLTTLYAIAQRLGADRRKLAKELHPVAELLIAPGRVWKL